MKRSLHTLIMLVVAAAVMVTFGRCGGDEGGPDASTSRDGSGPPPGPDSSVPNQADAASNPGGADTGNSAKPDATTTTSADVGATLTTIPVINDQSAPGHAAFAAYPNNRVHFKGVVASPIFRDYKKTSGSNPQYWYCRMGIYLADPNATSAEHNGVLVTSEGTVALADAGTPTPGNCVGNSVLEQLEAAGDAGLQIGEELEITGYFQEDCFRAKTDAGYGECSIVDQSQKGISRAVVEANARGSIARTGQAPGLPSSLPAVVSIEDVTSTGGPPSVTVGPKWWDYRQVLVKVEGVKAIEKGISCNWKIQKQDGTGATIIVQDDVMFMGTDCPGQPALNAQLQSVTGFRAWFSTSTSAESQLAPRGLSDIVPQQAR
ncbi:MAG: hypothetical protein HY901_14530 [Deltaproteobacteria bacterium]|nr:hypothetical protein [Deltaproteobacteria bacterium]